MINEKSYLNDIDEGHQHYRIRDVRIDNINMMVYRDAAA